MSKLATTRRRRRRNELETTLDGKKWSMATSGDSSSPLRGRSPNRSSSPVKRPRSSEQSSDGAQLLTTKPSSASESEPATIPPKRAKQAEQPSDVGEVASGVPTPDAAAQSSVASVSESAPPASQLRRRRKTRTPKPKTATKPFQPADPSVSESVERTQETTRGSSQKALSPYKPAPPGKGSPSKQARAPVPRAIKTSAVEASSDMSIYGPSNPSPRDRLKLPVRYFASVTGISPQKEREYRELHANVWPEVKQAISRANIRNYNIFITEVDGRKLLVSHMEYVGRDIRRDLEIISSDVVTRDRWWPLTNACQEVLKGTPEGSRWKPMEQIMHLP